MNKLEAKPGALEESLEQCQFSLDQLLGQEEHQSDFASYLAKVNKRRSELEFDELTGNEIGVKLAFAFKTNQLELCRSARDYLEARGNLLNQGMDPKELILDLAACDLSEIDLWRANLVGADLREADLSRADLREADLRQADLSRADLREADLRQADLREAFLLEADLRQAFLLEADLREACFYGVDLRGIHYLDFITASRAIFTGAKLKQPELEALNRLDRKERSSLIGASGLVRDKSGKIIGIEPLPTLEPETPEVQEETNEIMNQVVTLLVALGHENSAVRQEAAKVLIKGLEDLEIQPTNE